MKKLLALLLCVLLVNANATNMSRSTAEILMHKYGIIECKVNATAWLLDEMAGYNVSGDNQAQKTAILDSLAALKAYAEEGNITNFNAGVRELQENMKDAAVTLRKERREGWGADQNNGEKGKNNADIIKLYEDARRMQAQCLREVAPALARAELKEWKEWQEQKRERATALAKKKIITDKLNNILDAHNRFVNRYSELIGNSTVEELRTMRTELVQEQLKLRAEYEIEYMRILLNAINQTATEKGYAGDVASISSMLDSASQKITEYNEEQFKSAWDELKEAAKKLRELFANIKKAGR